ncbi:hypothetical protein ACFE04_013981 [Oxalis oulophora]
MATTSKNILFITILLLIMFLTNIKANDNSTIPKFSSLLIFGDSTVDTGNNNYIPTLLKANRLPYGKDFPGHTPTGRFSNGKLVPDIIATLLGIKDSVPAFLDPNVSDQDIVTGVSFASAGTGFDDLTAHISNVISISGQIDMFNDYIVRLTRILGEDKAKKNIAESLVIISAATNDFSIDYYDIPIRRLLFSVSGYQDFLLSKLQDLIEKIYELGCRNIMVAGLPPVGCLPIQMTAKFRIPIRTCLEEQNSDARAYNEKLGKLLPEIQAKLNGSKVLYADIYKPLNKLIQDPKKYGFVETTKGCCGTGLLEVSFLCNVQTPLCANASQYVFFDSIHPSEATYKFITQSLIQDLLPKLIGGP